jgi:hydroxyacylglutathione hydrolase
MFTWSMTLYTHFGAWISFRECGCNMAILQHTINTPYMVGPVHCYTTEVNGERILFDTGPPTSSAEQYLSEHLDLDNLKYVFITHCHIDHYGLASWLEQQTDAEIFVPYRDGLKMVEHDKRVADMYALLKDLGFDSKYIEEFHRTFDNSSTFPSFPKNFHIVEDDMPADLGIHFLNCPGHSQSDVVYHNSEWAVTGDVLLRGVFQSPLLDVDLETGQRFRNYDAYCATLKKVATLREKKICPSHRDHVDSVDEVLLFYVSKMLDRAAMLDQSTRRQNVAKILESLFGSKLQDPLHIYLKASEIVFMQDFLENPQLLENSLKAIGLFDELAESFTRATQ